MVVSKRKVKTTISRTNVAVEKVYCRRCMKSKKPVDFFSAVDNEIDKNGYMSICKQCCNEIYNSCYRVERDISRAILRTCRKINLKFDETTLNSALLQIKTLSESGKISENIIGIYKSKLLVNNKHNFSDEGDSSDFDLTFSEIRINSPLVNLLEETEENVDLKQFWGENLDFDDYQFLERELSEWKRTHKCDTKAEETLLKEICYKVLEIRKRREENSGATPTNLTKELQDLMKTANLDPAKVSMANSGKSRDTFSSFVKIIEENEPAEYYKDKNMFKDFDNLDFYFKKYVTRPLKNFITLSRDFNVSTEDDVDEVVEELKEGDNVEKRED